MLCRFPKFDCDIAKNEHNRIVRSFISGNWWEALIGFGPFGNLTFYRPVCIV